MAKQKKKLDKVTISIVISKTQHAQIEKMCWHMSKEQQKTITFSEAVRLALEEVYPYQKQTDLFNK